MGGPESEGSGRPDEKEYEIKLSPPADPPGPPHGFSVEDHLLSIGIVPTEEVVEVWGEILKERGVMKVNKIGEIELYSCGHYVLSNWEFDAEGMGIDLAEVSVKIAQGKTNFHAGDCPYCTMGKVPPKDHNKPYKDLPTGVEIREEAPKITTLRCSVCGGPCALDVGCLTHAAAAMLLAACKEALRFSRNATTNWERGLAEILEASIAKAEGRP
jgi:hypothetical protein